MRRPKRLGFVMMLRRLWCEFAVDDDFPGCRGQADIGLHLGQQARNNLVGSNPTPVNVLALHSVVRVDAIKGADKISNRIAICRLSRTKSINLLLPDFSETSRFR